METFRKEYTVEVESEDFNLFQRFYFETPEDAWKKFVELDLAYHSFPETQVRLIVS